MRHGRSSKSGGFTLIEVLVTLMVFTIGLAGFAAMQTTAMREVVDSQQRSLAVWRSQELIDRVRANPGEVDTFIAQVGSFSCSAAPATRCADYFSGSKQNAATCTATQMATYDVWDIMCGGKTDANDANSDGLGDKLIGLVTSLTCSDSPCAVDSDLTLTLTWTSHAAQGNQDITQSAAFVNQSITTVFRP
jgi:type IV pilus assembly protein PilV